MTEFVNGFKPPAPKMTYFVTLEQYQDGTMKLKTPAGTPQLPLLLSMLGAAVNMVGQRLAQSQAASPKVEEHTAEQASAVLRG